MRTHANLGNRQMQMTHLLLPSLVHAPSMPQNKNNELSVFCPDIMTHKRQYHVMSMSYSNRQLSITLLTNSPDAAANAKYNLEILKQLFLQRF